MEIIKVKYEFNLFFWSRSENKIVLFDILIRGDITD